MSSTPRLGAAGSFGAMDPASHDLYMFLEKLQEQQREVVALIKARQDVIARRAAEAGSPKPLPLPPTSSPLRPVSERFASPTSPATTPSSLQASRLGAAADAEAQAQAKKVSLAALANAPVSPATPSEADARRRKALQAKQAGIGAGGMGTKSAAFGVVPGGQTTLLAMQTATGEDAVMTQDAMQTSTTTGEHVDGGVPVGILHGKYAVSV